MTVRVTNRNSFTHKDKFNGDKYEFPAGESVHVPDEVAAHIFGYGSENPHNFMVRAGWDRQKNGAEIFNNFEIVPVTAKYVAEGEEEGLPETPQVARRPGRPPKQAAE